MALQKAHNDRFGNSHSAAYHKIDEMKIDYKSETARVVVCTYKDLAARTDNKEAVERREFVVDSNDAKFSAIFSAVNMDSKNPLKGFYQHLSSLSEFDGSTDV